MLAEVFKAAGAGRSSAARERLHVNLVLGILKDFEKRSLLLEDFESAASSRSYAVEFRRLAEERLKDHMVGRHAAELDSLLESHVIEAVKFNEAWGAQSAEFEGSAAQLLDELRAKHHDALEGFTARQQHEALGRAKHTREMIELKQVQGKLARSGNYAEAKKCQRKMAALARRDREGRQEQVNAYVKKRVDTHRAAQRLELEALTTRLDRARVELRTRWSQGAQRLMQSHKNMLRDLKSRHSLEASRADATLRSELMPHIAPRRKRGVKPAGARSPLPSRSASEARAALLTRPSKAAASPARRGGVLLGGARAEELPSVGPGDHRKKGPSLSTSLPRSLKAR